jgi:hypothetical protein
VTYVWYVGNANVRTITVVDWSSIGITVTGDTTWDQDNGWSVPTSSLSGPQLTYLESETSFVTGQTDAERPTPAVNNDGGGSSGLPASQNTGTKFLCDSISWQPVIGANVETTVTFTVSGSTYTETESVDAAISYAYNLAFYAVNLAQSGVAYSIQNVLTGASATEMSGAYCGLGVSNIVDPQGQVCTLSIGLQVNSGILAGMISRWLVVSAGTVEFTMESGVTIKSVTGAATMTQMGVATFYCLGNDEWLLDIT